MITIAVKPLIWQKVESPHGEFYRTQSPFQYLPIEETTEDGMAMRNRQYKDMVRSLITLKEDF